LTRALFLFLIALIAFAQPGVPPCWMMAQACAQHPHFVPHPDTSHDHGYLYDLSAGYVIALSPARQVPAALLIALLGLAGLFRRLVYSLILHAAWQFPPELTPPRPAPCAP
jgi:hypothetical protein